MAHKASRAARTHDDDGCQDVMSSRSPTACYHEDAHVHVAQRVGGLKAPLLPWAP